MSCASWFGRCGDRGSDGEGGRTPPHTRGLSRGLEERVVWCHADLHLGALKVALERLLNCFMGSSTAVFSHQMAMKCADLGHLASAEGVHLKWVGLLEEEMFRQGDKEKARGYPVSPLMDRDKAGITRSQPGVSAFFFLQGTFNKESMSPVWHPLRNLVSLSLISLLPTSALHAVLRHDCAAVVFEHGRGAACHKATIEAGQEQPRTLGRPGLRGGHPASNLAQGQADGIEASEPAMRVTATGGRGIAE